MKPLLIPTKPGSARALAGLLVVLALGTLSQAQADTFNYTGALQSYTVPETGYYAITAYGAQGGYGGGLGAEVGGLFTSPREPC